MGGSAGVRAELGKISVPFVEPFCCQRCLKSVCRFDPPLSDRFNLSTGTELAKKLHSYPFISNNICFSPYTGVVLEYVP